MALLKSGTHIYGNLQVDTYANVGANVSIGGVLYITNTGDVSANLGAYYTYANANVSGLQNQITGANTNIQTTSANLGAYQTFANANAVSQQNQITGANTNIQTTSANLGAYQTFANANVASLQNQITGANTNIQTTSANLGAYQTFANANIATIQANIGSFYNYANTKIGTNSNSNLVVVATTTADSTTTGALVVAGGAGVAGNVNLGGNLYLSGTGARIIGDFSNATIASRVAFQTSTTNGFTAIPLFPNGTGTLSGIVLHNSSDLTNASRGWAYISSSEFRIQSDTSGSGTYLPITFYTNQNERVRMDTGGNVMFGYTSVINPGSATNNYVFAGNMGINTSTLTANYLLDMVGPTDTSIVRLRATAATTTKAAQFILSTQNARDFVFTSQHDASTPYARIETGSAMTGGLRFYYNGTESARIDTGGNLLVGYTASPTTTAATSNFAVAGNVGIGTNAPITRLHVQTASAGINDGIYVTDGTRWIRSIPYLGSGSYNALVISAGDSGIIYSAGTPGTGNFVIAPWNNTVAGGIRMDNSGNVTVASNLSVTATTTSTSTTTGALVVAGGAGVAGNVTAANVFATGVFIGSGSAVSGLFWSANNAAVSTGGSGSFTGGTVTGATYISDTTPSTSTSTGALTVAGGVGVVANVNIGGNLTVNGNIVAPDASFIATTILTHDMVTIDNTGYPVTTAGVNALNVTYIGGSAAVESEAIRVDMTPGTTSGGIWNSFRVVSTNAAAAGVVMNGIKFDNKSSGTGTSNMIFAGTGYDNIITLNGNTIISGTGAGAFTTVTDNSGSPIPNLGRVINASMGWNLP